MNNSDFPEFDQAYRTVLVKDLEDKFEQLAARANFNIYHCDIWRGTARKFAELIVQECIDAIDAARPYHTNDHLVNDYINGVEHGHKFAITMIIKHFGVE